MSAVGLVAGVIVAFFIVGIGVGVLAMVALSTLKYRRPAQRDDWRARRRRRFGLPADGGDGVGWQEPPGLDDYSGGAGGHGDGPTRWPGG